MLNLVSLKFNNIGKYTTEQEYIFEGLGKLILVDGPSGAGKSTIFHALDYLLGINLIPSTQLQCRYTNRSMKVTGIFRVDNDIVTITRSKKDGLKIELPNKTIQGCNDLVEESLDQIIGVPRKLLKRMIHKPQKEGGFFMSLTAKQSYEFLIEVLGLKEHQDKIEKISEEISGWDKLKTNLNAQISANQIIITELTNSLNSETEPTCDIKEEDIKELKIQLKAKKCTYNDICDQIKQEAEAVTVPQNEEPTIDLTVYNTLLKRKQELDLQKKELTNTFFQQKEKYNTILNILKNNLKEIESIKKTYTKNVDILNQLNNELQEANNNSCPTCKQKWITQGIEIYKSDVQSQIKEIEDQQNIYKLKIEQETETTTKTIRLQEIINALTQPDLTSIEQQLNDIIQAITVEHTKYNNIKQTAKNEYLIKQNEYIQKINKIEKKATTMLEGLNQELTQIQNDITQKQYRIDTEKQNLNKYLTNKKRITATIQEKEVQLSNYRENLGSLNRKIAIASEAKRLIKSYTIQMFQETLNDIGEMASQIIGNVHNMANASIYFEGCKENKNGSIKDEVTAIINKSGENEIPIKTLSGGERTVVDLAVDLAVIDVIESKVGKGANFFILDEPFTGLDGAGIGEYMDILNNINTHKRIIIVDHSPELKNSIPDVISIKK